MDTDQFSHPMADLNLKIARLFFMKPRISPGKEGRQLLVNFDKRFPLIEGFEINYSYTVRFLEKDNIAGNHYHKIKRELMIPQAGAFEFKLKDIHGGETKTLQICAEDNAVLQVNPEVAHSVRALEKGAVLLVLANAPNNDGDEFEHSV